MLSALVVARNEDAQLADCLARLSFVNEMVVVLDRSTDRSKEIALSFHAKIVEGSWEVEGQRRQAGQDACSGEWIIEVDADERISAGLAAEIKDTLKDTKADWHRVPFDNYIGQRLVRYGWGAHFGVGAKIILFKKGVKSWGDQRVHPKVKMEGPGGGSLKAPMAHYVDQDITDMIYRLDRYATLNAADLFETGNSGSYRKNIARIFGRFWKCFVLRRGYREGYMGMLIAICAGLYPILSYMKMKELQDRRS